MTTINDHDDDDINDESDQNEENDQNDHNDDNDDNDDNAGHNQTIHVQCLAQFQPTTNKTTVRSA